MDLISKTLIYDSVITSSYTSPIIKQSEVIYVIYLWLCIKNELQKKCSVFINFLSIFLKIVNLTLNVCHTRVLQLLFYVVQYFMVVLSLA